MSGILAFPSVATRVRPVKEAIQKADVLIEALHWIRQFRETVTVVKLGGSVMEDTTSLQRLLEDVVFMETVGLRPVIVHGGGAAISRAMAEAKIEPRFVHGRRYTDDDTLTIVERVLAYEINHRIEMLIEEFGGHANSLNFRTTNVLFGENLRLNDDAGNPLDLGHVGQVTRVDRQTITKICNAGAVPIIPSMCLDAAKRPLNVNADTAAMAVAAALGAEKLVFLSDVNGVRRDKSDPDSLIHSLSAVEAEELIASGTIDSGMIPKVQACLDTLAAGVNKVHIIDGRLRHSLLLEIFTREGVGTEIVKRER